MNTLTKKNIFSTNISNFLDVNEFRPLDEKLDLSQLITKLDQYG
ncbi:MAG: hypothetical protein ACJ0GH_05450 [Alphaproteobacteria bacterium]